MQRAKQYPIRARNRMSDQRGTALFITLVLLVALVAISAGAITMTGTERRLRIYSQAQVDLRYQAELAAEMGLSRVNLDELALPDTGYSVLEYGYPATDAFGESVRGIELNIYAGRTGSATGTIGNYASIVGQAVGRGATSVVRLEITEESFAKFAYFTDNEGGNIWFAGGDQLFGPVHSNDQIKIHSTGATFHADVSTAKNILYADNGTFLEGYEEESEIIPLPDGSDMARLEALAAAGNTYFATPSVGAPSNVQMRIEFLAIDVDGDGDDVDPNEGFFRLYRSPLSKWLAAQDDDYWTLNCGDVHVHPVSGEPRFISASQHKDLFEGGAYNGPYPADVGAWSGNSALRHGTGSWPTVYRRAVTQPSSRCYLGGDPRLTMDGRSLSGWNGAADESGWLRRADYQPGATIPAAVATRDDADYLFPLARVHNPDFRGVFFFDGLIGVSGVLNGRVTIATSDNIVLLDDFTYSVPANTAKCNDIAGFLSSHNFYISDNNLNTPQRFPNVGGARRTYDNTASEFIDGIILALESSFTVENYWAGPKLSEACEGQANGRGCIYLTGGLIQDIRGAVGLTDGHGYIKRYAYDSNARFCPPPHYPTTGRYKKNRYYEVNPQVFGDVGEFFADIG